MFSVRALHSKLDYCKCILFKQIWDHGPDVFKQHIVMKYVSSMIKLGSWIIWITDHAWIKHTWIKLSLFCVDSHCRDAPVWLRSSTLPRAEHFA